MIRSWSNLGARGVKIDYKRPTCTDTETNKQQALPSCGRAMAEEEDGGTPLSSPPLRQMTRVSRHSFGESGHPDAFTIEIIEVLTLLSSLFFYSYLRNTAKRIPLQLLQSGVVWTWRKTVHKTSKRTQIVRKEGCFSLACLPHDAFC